MRRVGEIERLAVRAERRVPILAPRSGDRRRLDGSEVARYNFENAWVSKVSMGTLKAGSNEVLMEEVSIVTEALNRVL